MKKFTKLQFPSGIDRYSLVLGTLLFAGSFHLAYVNWLVPVYGDLGFTYSTDSTWPIWLGYFLSALPSLWMPISLRRPSQFLHWAIYFTTYIPGLLTLGFRLMRPPGEVIMLQLYLLGGMVILGLSYRFPKIRLCRPKLSKTAFVAILATGTAMLFARVIFVYRTNFHFVSWQDAYSIRYTGSDIATEAGLAYPINWLSFIFLPFIMAMGLWSKRWWLFAFAVAGTVLLYSTQGMKHILFSGAYIWAMYVLLRRRSEVFGLRFVWSIAFLLLIFTGLVSAFSAQRSELAMLFGANFVLRIFGNNGLLISSYHWFFADHPLTYYSYISGVNLFVHYPYDYPLGMEISRAAGGIEEAGRYNNQNAGFWATDGLAAIGLPGILLISVIMALVFYALDSFSASQKAAVVALCLSQYVLVMTNVSFFTSLITGGLVFIFLIFFLMPKDLSHRSVPSPRLRSPNLSPAHP